MIATKTWREIRLLVLLYVALLEVQIVISTLMWPWLREQSPALARLVLSDFMKRWVEGLTDPDRSVAFNAYMALQTFFKGANVMGTAFAILFGTLLIARERENHTLEFLLARPVSRPRILWVKFAVTTAALAIPIFVTSWSTIPLSWIVDESLPFWEVTVASAYSALFCTMVLAATTVCSVRFRTQLHTLGVIGAIIVFQLAIYFVQQVRLVSLFRLSDYDVYGPVLAGNVGALELFLTRGVWILVGTVGFYLLANRLFRKAEL